jgi:hypothetical protein
MAPRTLNPNELIEVVWADTQQMVTLPRHLTAGASKAAQERHLIATGQLIDPAAPILDTPAPEQVIQTVTDTAALAGVERRLQALEQRPVPVLPSEESLAQWAIAAQRVGLSHQELAALVEQTTSSCEATAAAAQARLDGLDAQQQALTEQVSAAVSEGQQATAEMLANASQQLAGIEAEAIDAATTAAKKTATPVAREAALAEVAKHWGSSVTIAAELPTETDPQSWAKRWYGRDFLIPGDGALVETPNSLRTFRFTGRGWVEGGTIEPKVVAADIKTSVLDASTKVTSLQTISGSGGGGGGGGEHLLVNRIGLGGSTAIGDTSNWAGISDPRSGVAQVDLLAMDGGNQGKTYALELPFTWDSSGDQFTADGELGNLLGLYTVSLSVQRSPAVAPAVYTGAMPPGAQRLVTFLTVTPAPGGGGDTTQFRLSGSISYNHVAQGAAVSLQTGGLQPLWIWS